MDNITRFITTVLGIIYTIYASWIVTLFWSWYIVPFGVIQIKLAHAFGLLIFYQIFCKIPDEEESLEICIKKCISGTIVLAYLAMIGFITQFFFM